MMSPNNQPLSGKQIYVAERGQETEEAGKKKGKTEEQSEWQIICNRGDDWD